MHRFSSDLSDKSINSWKISYLEVTAVAIIQFLISMLFLCYGVFLMQLIQEDSINLKNGLWTAVLFIAVNNISSPCFRYCEKNSNKTQRYYIVISSILLFASLVLLSFNKPIFSILYYGFFGGLLSTSILENLKLTTVLTLNLQLFDVLNKVIKAFSLLLMPHLVLFLTNFYGPSGSFLIFGGLILNIAPIAFLTRQKKPQKRKLCKYKTLDQLSIEMTDLTSKPIIEEESTSSSDEEEEEKQIPVEEENNKPAPLSPHHIQKYFQNVGVNILPDIPEESDIEEEDDLNEISTKKLNRISAILQEINEHSPREISLSVTNLFQPDQNIENNNNNDSVSEFSAAPKKESTFRRICSSYKLEKRRFKAYCHKHFVRTLPIILKAPFFYVALISNSINTTLTTVVFATNPYLMFLKKEDNSVNNLKTAEESTFLLTIIGFSWLFFLAGYPTFNRLSSIKIKLLFVAGLAFIGLSLLIVHKFSYDNFVLFSLTFGLGHGIVDYAENIANKQIFGEVRWKKIEGALEIFSGILLILIYSVIYLSNLEIYELLSNAYWIYLGVVAMWLFAFFFKIVKFACEKKGRYNLQQNLNFK